MSQSNYFYPDRDEGLTSKLIQEYDDMRWTLEEAYVLKSVKETLGEKEKLGLSMDVGTGLGRLIPFLLSISKKVIALDADLWRLKKAMEAFDSNPNVFFMWTQGSRLDPIPPQTVDFINYSHVAQHVTHPEFIETLGEFHRVLKRGGRVLFLTTHSEGKEKFLVSTEEGAIEITRDEYEELTLSPQPKRLPVRKFDLDSLENLLRECGFEIEWKIYYHIRPEFAPIVELRELKNPSCDPTKLLETPEKGVEDIIRNLESINADEREARKKALDVALLLRKG